MDKKIISAVALLFLTMGCAALAPLEVKEEKYGKAVPVITQSFASPKLRPGDTWKVYLKASDPDGDMKNIYATIAQPGMAGYPVSITRIKEGGGKDLSGYVYLNTVGVQGMNFVTITLTVEIQDKAGHFSKPAVFPLSFNFVSQKETPPPGTFLEKDLGPIMITLRSAFDGDSQREGSDYGN
ncbi:MAG: hypothetical protein Q7W38_01010 [Deltaproteobacteria bacterium]|nr:hypothetical protein [Deltaproteobacteria bacterium]